MHAADGANVRPDPVRSRVPTGARACKECGADERTGWDEEKTRYDGLNLPDSAFEDDDAPRRSATGQTPSIFWWVVAVGLLLLSLGWLWW